MGNGPKIGGAVGREREKMEGEKSRRMGWHERKRGYWKEGYKCWVMCEKQMVSGVMDRLRRKVAGRKKCSMIFINGKW